MIRKRQILFVGVNENGSCDLHNGLARMHPDWEASFAASGEEALRSLQAAEFCAVISDLHLPDMDGVQLLDAVRRSRPEAQRVIVSELSDRAAAMKCAGIAHECVPKPWDVRTLKSKLERSFSLNVWLSNPTVRGLAARMSTTPSPPELYFEVVRLLQTEDVALDDVSRRVAQDPAMTAKLLQLANSAVLGLRRKVTSAHEAMSYLGLETTRSLLLLAHTFSYCEQTRTAGFSIEHLWQHSLQTGTCARRIAQLENASAELTDECFLAGLLHDIGKLLLAVNLPAEYKSVVDRTRTLHVSPWEAELEQFGATHGEVGAELLALWNLPLSVVEALALHHYPSKLISSTFSPLTAVHVANAIVHEQSAAKVTGSATAIELAYIEDLGLTSRIDCWRQAVAGQLKVKTQ